MKIVFVHGRSQEHKDRHALLEEWKKAAIAGIAKAGLPTLLELSNEHTVLPYYGDLLFELSEAISKATDSDLVDRAAEVPTYSSAELEFQRAIVMQMATVKGITAEQLTRESESIVVDRDLQNWKIVLTALRLLSKVPFISETAIEQFTHDVWCYLTMKGLRMRIDAIVDRGIPANEPCIVVAHSLGSIVAYNLLMNRKRDNVKAFLTLGSPLGIEAIWDRLPSDTPPRHAPPGVGAWFNARDRHDTVALFEINADNYKGNPVVSNYSGVENLSPNHHGIVEYLKDEMVARKLHASVS